jgi:hypothetical protein
VKAWLEENLLAVGIFGLCTALVQVCRAGLGGFQGTMLGWARVNRNFKIQGPRQREVHCTWSGKTHAGK